MKRRPRSEQECSPLHREGQRSSRRTETASSTPRKLTLSAISSLAAGSRDANYISPANHTRSRGPMPDMQARLKPEYSLRYPRLSAGVWYDVSPIFPGVTVRRADIFGRRLTRLKTDRDFEKVQDPHLELRERAVEQQDGQLATA